MSKHDRRGETQHTHYSHAGADEVCKALVAEGFPEDAANRAVNVTVPPDDDPRYLGWTLHLPEARAYALRYMRERIETYDFDIRQLRRQIEEKRVERTAMAAALAELTGAKEPNP